MAAWLREGKWALLEIKQGGPLTHGLLRSPDRGMDAPYVVVTMERRSPASRGCLRLIGRRPRPRTRFKTKPCAAGVRWTARGRVLGRAHIADMATPCVLASHRPSHPGDEASF